MKRLLGFIVLTGVVVLLLQLFQGMHILKQNPLLKPVEKQGVVTVEPEEESQKPEVSDAAEPPPAVPQKPSEQLAEQPEIKTPSGKEKPEITEDVLQEKAQQVVQEEKLPLTEDKALRGDVAAMESQASADLAQAMLDQEAEVDSKQSPVKLQQENPVLPHNQLTQAEEEKRAAEIREITRPIMHEPAQEVASQEKTVQSKRQPEQQDTAREVTQLAVTEEQFVAVAATLSAQKLDTASAAEWAESDYGWGVLNEYINPDQAAQLLGGVLVLKSDGRYYRAQQLSGQWSFRPVAHLGRAYGSIGLAVNDARLKRHMESGIRASNNANIRDVDGLWYMFPRERSSSYQQQILTTFQCQMNNHHQAANAGDEFLKAARLRNEVVVLKRPNGGKLGVMLPRYFDYQGKRMPVQDSCRMDDTLQLTQLIAKRGA